MQHYTLELNSSTLRLINKVSEDKSKEYILDVVDCPTKDGEIVPCTLFYKKKSVKLDRKNKLICIGYGAYGLSQELKYDSILHTAVDKGWIVAFSHIRGGYEFGEIWHKKGKLLEKKNSIEDYISVILELIRLGFSHPNYIIGYGVSAGGIVVGQAINLNPQLFRAVILSHPFVDVLSSLVNDDYRMTVTDHKEFGNPVLVESDYFNIISWSPYENISCKEYPAVFITMSTNDTRVASFGVLKYIEKLRLKSLPPKRLPDFVNNSKNIVVQFEDEGHFGPISGEEGVNNRLRELAWADKMMIEDSNLI